MQFLHRQAHLYCQQNQSSVTYDQGEFKLEGLQQFCLPFLFYKQISFIFIESTRTAPQPLQTHRSSIALMQRIDSKHGPPNCVKMSVGEGHLSLVLLVKLILRFIHNFHVSFNLGYITIAGFNIKFRNTAITVKYLAFLKRLSYKARQSDLVQDPRSTFHSAVLRARHSISLCLSFLICEIQIIILQIG